MVRDAAFQAAEAGLDDYTSKLLDDNQFYLHDVAVGESTGGAARRAAAGRRRDVVDARPPGPTGRPGPTPNGKDNWRSLTNGYEYNIQVTAPTSTNNCVDIIASRPEAGHDRARSA